MYSTADDVPVSLLLDLEKVNVESCTFMTGFENLIVS